MELVLICIAVFLSGALVGFGIATIYTSANTIRLYDDKRELMKELADTRAQKEALEEIINGNTPKPPVAVLIADNNVAKGVDFGDF